MSRSLGAKLGLRAGMRSLRLYAPDPFPRAGELPALDLRSSPVGPFEYIHLFAAMEDGLADDLPALIEQLADGGMLWVSWPKARQLGTDLTQREVIRIGYHHGMVESTTLSLDSVWSAIKFTRPKPGKVYRNSYGTLPG